MKLKLSTLALPFALLACEAPTTSPPSTARALTPAEVRATATHTQTVLAPAFTDALRGLETSKLLHDLEIDLSELPSGADVAREVQPYVDAIFADASIEAQSDTEISYRVPAAQVCGGASDCERALTTHPVRFVASSNAVGVVHLAMEVGARRIRPLSLDVSADRVDVELDVAGARAVLAELAVELELEPSELPIVAEGQLRAELGAHELAVSGRARVEGAIEGAAYRLSIGDSIASLDLDAASHTAVGEVGLGAVAIELPLAWIAGTSAVCDVSGSCETTTPTGQLAFALAGLSAHLHLDATTDTAILDDLGLGGAPLTVALDGARQLAFELSELDLSLRYLRQQLELSVSPVLEASLTLSMEALAAQLEIAPWAVHDTLRARFDGASSPTLLVDLEGEGARVVAGTLTLSSAASTLTASADECVGARDDVPEGAGFVEALMSFPCE